MGNDKGLLDGLFDDFFGSKKTTTKTVTSETVKSEGYVDSQTGRSYRTKRDVSGMSLEVDLPGIPPADVKLWHEGNQLILNVAKGGTKYASKFTIGPEYDVSSATAKLTLGLLTVKMVPAEKRDYHRIRIDIT
jgi:HSP20 family molecular chaperone IbpA